MKYRLQEITERFTILPMAHDVVLKVCKFRLIRFLK